MAKEWSSSYGEHFEILQFKNKFFNFTQNKKYWHRENIENIFIAWFSLNKNPQPLGVSKPWCTGDMKYVY